MVLNTIWSAVKEKWPDLFNDDSEDRNIIQGAIGYSSVNKVVNETIKTMNVGNDMHTILTNIRKSIEDINVPESNWKSGGKYSKLSSEYGYSMIAKELLDSYEY